MASVEVRDLFLWPKHIEGDARLQKTLMELHPGGLVELEVDGVKGIWKQVRRDRRPHPTPGFQPTGESAEKWRALVVQYHNRTVPIRLVKIVEPAR